MYVNDIAMKLNFSKGVKAVSRGGEGGFGGWLLRVGVLPLESQGHVATMLHVLW